MSIKTVAFPNIDFWPHDETIRGAELLELGSLYQRANGLDHDTFAPHRLNFHLLIYIAEGSGTHFIDFNRYSYRAGSFISVGAGQVHAFDLKNKPQGSLILFTQAFLETIRTTIRVPLFLSGVSTATEAPILTAQGSLKESCEGLLTELKGVSGEKPHDELMFQLLFTILALKLHQLRPDNEENQVSEERRQQFGHFLCLVKEKYCSEKDVALYADLMGITYKSLNAACKLVSNKTPKQIIDAHIILEAKRRLAIESIQVTKLAYELGFDDVSNFVKYFKKHTLVTPSQFQTDSIE